MLMFLIRQEKRYDWQGISPKTTYFVGFGVHTLSLSMMCTIFHPLFPKLEAMNRR